MDEEWLHEGADDTEFVVYRTGYPNGPLEYLPAMQWDNYVKGVPNTRCLEISRGHTITEAVNLTMLANSGDEK